MQTPATVYHSVSLLLRPDIAQMQRLRRVRTGLWHSQLGKARRGNEALAQATMRPTKPLWAKLARVPKRRGSLQIELRTLVRTPSATLRKQSDWEADAACTDSYVLQVAS